MNLLVSDYDGTLSTNKYDMKINCEYLNNFINSGNKFVLSSGRPLISIKRQIEMYNIPYSYIASSDGSYLFDKNDNLLLANHMSKKIIDEIDDLKKLDIYREIQYSRPRYNGTTVDNDEIGSIAFVIEKDNITDEFLYLYNKLKENNSNDYQFETYGYDKRYFYMVRPKGVNKSVPIRFLEKKLKIPKSKIYTIGDNNNDIEMIRDYNGFMIGDNEDVEKVALKKYNSVHELIKDINKKKVLKRW